MQTFEVHKATDFAVYKQIVRGAYNPVTVAKPAYKSAFFLVRSANTCIVCSAATKNDAEQFITATDLTAFGYHSMNDIEISYTNNEKLKSYQAVIVPRNIYPLGEDISLPDPPDEKGKIFQDFIADELERIKLRAEYVMYGALPNDKIRSFAVCNLQLLRKLYHDSRISFNRLCSCSGRSFNQSDLYILYTLNLFIIRCIVFYAKFFKPFLNEEPPSEQIMRNTFHNEMPRMLKYPWLFMHHPPLYEVIADYNNPAQVCEVNPAYQKTSLSGKPEIPDALLKEALEIIQLKGFIKLNCNKNAFLAEVFKMRYEKNPDGKTLFSAERKKLLQLLSFIVTDEEGNPLNPHTANTVTKPSNIIKRPGK